MQDTELATAFPVDAVYSWVDGNDPVWLEKKNATLEKSLANSRGKPADNAVSDGRFVDNGELRYALRSLALYAPWVRHVYLITDNQRPVWIREDKVQIVDHLDIFPESADRPCFSTRPIELCSHRIEGLSEHYLLLNDDFFFGRPVSVPDFFSPDAKPVLRVKKKRRKYKAKLLSEDYSRMTPHRGANVFGRRLILERFGIYLPYESLHAPKPMLRSAMQEIWENFPEQVAHTLSGHFRKTDDLNISEFFSLYMMAAHKVAARPTNGFPGVIEALAGKRFHKSAHMGTRQFLKKLAYIKSRRPLTFCINDSEQATAQLRKESSHMLAEMFPHKCEYER